MTALVQAAISLQTKPASDFGAVAIFSLVGLTQSLAANFGFVVS